MPVTQKQADNIISEVVAEIKGFDLCYKNVEHLIASDDYSREGFKDIVLKLHAIKYNGEIAIKWIIKNFKLKWIKATNTLDFDDMNKIGLNRRGLIKHYTDKAIAELSKDYVKNIFKLDEKVSERLSKDGVILECYDLGNTDINI